MRWQWKGFPRPPQKKSFPARGFPNGVSSHWNKMHSQKRTKKCHDFQSQVPTCVSFLEYNCITIIFQLVFDLTNPLNPHPVAIVIHSKNTTSKSFAMMTSWRLPLGLKVKGVQASLEDGPPLSKWLVEGVHQPICRWTLTIHGYEPLTKLHDRLQVLSTIPPESEHGYTAED